MRSTLSGKGTSINGCRHPGFLNTRDCYVRTPMLLLSLVRPWIPPLSFLWEKVGPYMIARKYASRPDLRDQPIPDPDLVLYTNGTSLMKQGQQLSRYAVVMEESIVDASSLPSHWSAQQAELHALTQAFQLSKGKKTYIYTDSRFAFATLHVHRSLYKDRGLLIASEKDIKNKEEIKTLINATWEPERVAVIHCWGHQKEDNPRAQGNRLADETTKQATEGLGVTSEAPIKAFILAELPELTLDSPKYTEAQN